jgi:hypothetical protein
MNSHRCNLWEMCPRRAKRSNSLREITPKGLNVNKSCIDIINKIQQVIHFNKNSYNQSFFILEIKPSQRNKSYN